MNTCVIREVVVRSPWTCITVPEYVAWRADAADRCSQVSGIDAGRLGGGGQARAEREPGQRRREPPHRPPAAWCATGR